MDYRLPNNWTWKKLGDIAYVIGGVSYNPDDIVSCGIRIIRGGNIQNGIILQKTDDVFLPMTYANNENQVHKYDTVLVSSTGSVDALAKAATCFEEMPNTQIGAFMRIIRPKDEKYTMLVSAWCTSQHFRNYLISYARGTSINNIRTEFLTDFELPVPTDTELKSISSLYYNLEQKLLLNRQINRNLEALAKQIYDYWFVQFDFPDEKGRPYKSSGGKMVWNEVLKREIPKGWDVKNLGDILTKIDSGKRPAGGIDKSLKTGIPSLGAECIDELGVFDYSSTPYIANQYLSKLTSGRIEDNDILIYKDGAYVGKTTLFRDQFPFKDAFVNEHVFLIRANNIELEEYLLFTLKSEAYFQIMQTLGKAKAAQPGLNQQDLKQISVLIPDGVIALNFNAMVDNLFNSLFLNAKQIARLTNLRDELLPLLMNGQVNSDLSAC